MRTLGLDLGTNSIGWAVVDTNGRNTQLLAKGVYVFEKGVAEDQSGEKSRAAERTTYRAARRLKFRRKLRKLETLRVLKEYDFVPGLTYTALDLWRRKKIYPADPKFREWLASKPGKGGNQTKTPYYYRWLAATRQLDLSSAEDRYKLGRAFYHLAQRRGYRSNRKAGEEKAGDVKNEIDRLDEAMGNRTLGQYFYEDVLGRSEVRGEKHYTARKHYIAEFETICARQNLPEELRKKLHAAIFFQRPLRSQKGLVGRCTLERGRPRVPISHPDFEAFRALQFINNIRVSPAGETAFRPLEPDERERALKWVATRAKPEKFEKLSKKLAPRRAQIGYGERFEETERDVWIFNFRKDFSVAPCPTTARLIKLFGDGWREELVRRYRKSKGKSQEQVVQDIWHAMFYFDDPDKLAEFGAEQLGLNDEEAAIFAKPIADGYGNLSLRAIRKILPFLKQGLVYSHAVFMANLPTLLRGHVDWESEKETITSMIGELIRDHRMEISCVKAINAQVRKMKDLSTSPELYRADPAVENRLKAEIESEVAVNYGKRRWLLLSKDERDEIVEKTTERFIEHMRKDGRDGRELPVETLEQRIKRTLRDRYSLPDGALRRLYHPSALEAYPRAKPQDDGRIRLGSPRIGSIKNPVFMRTMHRLRDVVNALLDRGLIDSQTRVHVEMARDLNTANMRAAIYRLQRENEKRNDEYGKKIREMGLPDTPRNRLKYRLWEEQGELCMYTGEKIGLSEFLGENPSYDIEHTIPQSKRLDNSQSNLTLCSRDYNRRVKRDRIPSELPNAGEILKRVHMQWDGRIEELSVLFQKSKAAVRMAGDKARKDRAIQRMHYYRLQLDYWREKIRNFETEAVPEGFTNSQLVDTRIISKYASLYLKSLFEKVYSFKATALAGMREIWGVSEKYRGNHVHHAVDAILAAVLSPSFYNELAGYYHEHEYYEREGGARPDAPEPWPGFARYLNDELEDDVLVVHHHTDKLLKQTFKKVRRRDKVIFGEDGRPRYTRGDTARGPLHMDTNYGIIQPPPRKGGKQPELAVVIRKPLDSTFKEDAMIDKIVDPRVREIVRANKDRIGRETIWLNREKNIPIKRVRIYAAPSAGSLIELTKHRDSSRHTHKQYRLVVSGNNYITGIYRALVNGKVRGNWRLVSNYEAVQARKRGNWGAILPQIDEKGLRLKYRLKTGTFVLFYKDNPGELKELSRAELGRRLYYVATMEGRRARFDHHQTAVPKSKLGHGVSFIDWGSGRAEARLYLTLNNARFVVDGVEFRLTPLGEIEWLDTDDD